MSTNNLNLNETKKAYKAKYGKELNSDCDDSIQFVIELFKDKNKINERLVRWQGKLVNHSSHLNNVFIAIGTAMTGFVINLMFNHTSLFNCCQKINFIWGLGFIFLSVIFGLFGAISRLHDYRTTVRKIKREKENASLEELKSLVKLYEVFGKITWFCFYAQVISLIISTVIIGFILTNMFINK